MTWLVEIYYDYLDDIYCDVTQYKFSSKDLANKFIKECSVDNIFVYDEVSEYKTNLFFVVPDDYEKRPVFITIEDAVKDLEKLKDRYSYIYRYEVFSAKLVELEMKSLESEVRRLTILTNEYKQELEELRPQIRKLKHEYKQEFEELRP
jgi:hypothetical protein